MKVTRLRKALTAGLLAVGTAAMASISTAATVPYTSYTYDSYGKAVASSDVYEPAQVIGGNDIGAGSMIQPTDLFVTAAGDVYILDAGNKRVLVLDSRLQHKRTVDTFTLKGEASALNKPSGLFVDDQGRLYIADTGNNRIVCAGADGAIFQEIGKPASEYFSSSVEFLPTKLVMDRAGNLYVQCTGIYQGAVMFDKAFTFQGFFGSEKVVTTADALSDFFWKQFMTEEQKEAMSNYVPPEIQNMDITANDFIYTITAAQMVPFQNYKMEMDSVRRLNPKSGDTLINKMNKKAYSALEADARRLNFIDVCYDEKGFLNLLDNRKGRLLQFDTNMQLITAFGSIGEYAGTFISPVAVETLGDDILVLDKDKACLTVFRLTAVGANIHQALMLYNEGRYEQAIEPWKQVIQENPNFELAYIGVGSALYNQQQYKEAMDYFLLGRDSTRYSEAYKEYRIEIMRANLVYIVIGLIVMVVLLAVLGRLWKRRRARKHPRL